MNKLIKREILTEKPLYKNVDDFIRKTYHKIAHSYIDLINNEENTELIIKDLYSIFGAGEFSIKPSVYNNHYEIMRLNCIVIEVFVFEDFSHCYSLIFGKEKNITTAYSIITGF